MRRSSILSCILSLPKAAREDIIRSLGAAGADGKAKRSMSKELSEEERAEFSVEIERLRQEHRDLDVAIDALTAMGGNDRLQLQRLKKRKLLLRDRIGMLEDALTPDIIA